MKRLIFTAAGLLCVCLLAQSAFAQCDPRSDRIPFVQIRGDLLCGPDRAIPTQVTLVDFMVDGTTCPAADYDFEYPFNNPGNYKLEFWVDNTVAHVLAICVETQCDEGGNTVTYTGGFEQGGNPGSCDATVTFGASQAAILAPIVTPVQLSAFTATAN